MNKRNHPPQNSRSTKIQTGCTPKIIFPLKSKLLKKLVSTFDLYPSSSLSFQILVTKFYQSGQLFQKSRLQRPINLLFLPLHLFRYTKIASPSKNHPPLPSLLFHGRIPIKRKQLDAATERKGGDESELNETDVERRGKKLP